MDFWIFVIVLVLGVTAIEAIKDIVKKRAIGSKELESLHQDIALMKKDIEEVKEYLADLIIQNDR